MRGISGTLETALTAASTTPYIYLLFCNPDASITYDYSDRLLQLEHHEEAYDDYATIILRDEDKSIVDLRGYWVQIGYGFVTTASNEYATTPRLWVLQQQHLSIEGVLHVILRLWGMWHILNDITLRLGDPPNYDKEYTDLTVYAIMEAVLEAASLSLESGTFGLNAIGDQDDGIITAQHFSSFFVNQQPFETAMGVLRRLISMTKCYIRLQHSLVFVIRYPQAEDSADVTYYSDQQYYFTQFLESKNILTPNHILIACDELGEIVGEAIDQDEIDKYMEVWAVMRAENIDNTPHADERAAAILTRAKAELNAGRVLIRHDCRLELYDKVGIVDRRGL